MKCREAQIPLETTEQFIYTYLYQKYGLKSLILEWAAGIVNAVKIYAKDDPDVALFAKLLKNEFEEDFRFVQMRARETITGMFKTWLRKEHPH
jgi:hypothetical protein